MISLLIGEIISGLHHLLSPCIFLHTQKHKIRMVKKGGTKRKIEIEMIQKKESLRVTCTKRREGLFSKASQLCLLSGAQLAILATPPSSESKVSFYSFGHSSVDGVVSAFLSGQRPVPVPVLEDYKEMREDVGLCLTRKDLGLGFWWEDESLARSENPQELSDAIDSMRTLLSNLKDLRGDDVVSNQTFVDDHEDLKKSDVVVLHHATQDQTLNLQSTSAICCIPDDDLPEYFNEMITQEPDQALTHQSSSSTVCCDPDDLLVIDDDLPANFNEITEEQDQILAICESFCGTDNNNNYNNAETEVNLDYNQLIDFETPIESLLDDWFSDNTHQEHEETTTASLLTNSEAVYDHVSVKTTSPNLFSDFEALEDGDFMQQRYFDDDDLRFSNFFNELTSTI